MTIEELYEWAKANGVEDAEIIVRDYNGSPCSVSYPEITKNGELTEVEL